LLPAPRGVAVWSTVKVHRTHLMRKMKARSLPELSRMADTLNVRLQ
jgi:FixJ family two-component response regulator